MGKKSRKSTSDVIAKRKARAAQSAFVRRPFEGVAVEGDLISFKELVPAATLTAALTAEHGGAEILFASLLPGGVQAHHRADGVVLAGLQTPFSSPDPSRDVAAAVLRAIDSEPGTLIEATTEPGAGPRLQDILDPAGFGQVQVLSGFDYWLAEGQDDEQAEQVRAALEQANEAVSPTEKLTGADSAYWTQINGKEFVRWARDEDEDRVLDALARLHAAGENTLGGLGRFLGAFRAHGIVIPVWELEPGTQPDQVDEALPGAAAAFDAALASEEPLSAAERNARAGVASRQLTIR